MKEILIRAWNGRIMTEFSLIDLLYAVNSAAQRALPNGYCQWPTGDEQFMLYIGRKDKDGSMIYEDDIIEYFHWSYASIHKHAKIDEIRPKNTGTYAEMINNDLNDICGLNIDDKIKKEWPIIYKFTNAYGDSWYDLYKPLRGIVKWNEEVCTYEPLISAKGDFCNASFAYICRERPELFGRHGAGNYGVVAMDNKYPASYIKKIGNIYQNPDLAEEIKSGSEVEVRQKGDL
jgi:hypothetical protein